MGVIAAAPLYVLVLIKLTTNTLAAIALKLDRFALEWSSVNVFGDIVCLTGAIYFTGGQASPVFVAYVIELTVLALLSNLGVTLLCSIFAYALYAAMALLIHYDVLVQHSAPGLQPGVLSSTHVAVDLVFKLFIFGVPTFFTAVILHRLRHRERTLEARTRALIEALEQKSLFIANVTHELRTPIHGIMGLADLSLAEIYGPINDEQKEAQQQIKRTAKSLMQLVDDLLQLTKAEAGRLELKIARVDVRELTQHILSSARFMAGMKKLDVVLEIDPRVTYVRTDRGKITQVLVNFASNAVKFTSEGGTITIRARPDGFDATRFEVEDTGVGIAKDQQDRVFEAFRQIAGGDEREFGGVGLGLAIAKRLADALGAEIGVDSTPGKGATFWLRVLPVPDESDPGPEPLPEAARAPSPTSWERAG
jgi:signal transduction histidine kinase